MKRLFILLTLSTFFAIACGGGDDQSKNESDTKTVNDVKTADTKVMDTAEDDSAMTDDTVGETAIAPEVTEETAAEQVEIEIEMFDVTDCSQMQFSHCGGEVLGTWKFTDLCMDADPTKEITDSCPTATVNMTTQMGGQITFNDDNTGVRVTNFIMLVDLFLPTECLQGANCTMLAGLFSGECAEVEGGCDCTITQGGLETDNLEWKQENGKLLTKDEGEDEWDDMEYCVKGSGVTVKNIEKDEETGEETFMYFVAEKQ